MSHRVWWYANAAGKLAAPYERHQTGVPRLPIPSLEESCNRFLRAAAPLQSPAEHAATKHAVDMFCQPGGEGELLQNELKRSDAEMPRESSYIESLWYRAAYLGPRDPITINANPGVILATPPDPAQKEPLWRAASALSAIAHWLGELRAGKLPPMTAGGGKVPLCMSMTPSVLGSSRVPEHGCDRIQAAPDSAHAAIHWQGGWYTLPLFDVRAGAATPLSAAALLGALEQLPSAAAVASAAAGEPRVPLGAFTAGERDAWAAARAQLRSASPLNAASLDAIDSALVVLVLDEESPADLSALARATLCGDAAKRWYDKVMLIVYGGGQCGINFEHSPVDGAQMIWMAEGVTQRIAQTGPRPAAPPPPPAALEPRGLAWELPPPLGRQLDAARARVAGDAAALESVARVIPAVSLGWAKTSGVSLDTVVQMALQAGYRAVTGRTDSTYEACSTQNFLHGRTECVRSVTAESVALCAALADPAAGTPAQLAALDAALKAHRVTVGDCQRAHGHERHLVALKVKAAEMGRPTPALFDDPGWATVCSSVISTSGLRSPSIDLFCFGPVVPTGVGLAYLLQPGGVTLNVTSWRGKGPSAAAVADAIEASLEQLRDLVAKRPPRSKL